MLYLIRLIVNHFSKDSPICKALLDLDEDDYYLVEACYEYPYESLTLGSYEDNAFSLEKEVVVRLSYQD